MRILIATDIHGDEKVLKSLLSRNFDLLILLGDLTNRGKENHLFDLLPKNTVFIPGNNEIPRENFCHGKIFEFYGVKFTCLGGSPPTPFSTPFEVSDEEYARIAKKLKNFDILLSHSPPFGVLDNVNGKHVGSIAIKELIEREKPKIAFVGHVHEYAGSISLLGRTTVINPGPYGFFLIL